VTGEAPADLSVAAVDALLPPTPFVGRGLVLCSVPSTIDACALRADRGEPAGAWVAALAQTAGRGQHGRAWLSPPGGSLALTVLLRPRLTPDRVPLLTPLAGVSAVAALEESAGLAVRIKRPNDLLLRGADGAWRKVGGLLVDTAIQGPTLRHALVSLGLNVDVGATDLPGALAPFVTSLARETPVRPARAAVVAAFLRALAAWLRAVEEGGADRLLARHEELLVALPDFVLPEVPRPRAGIAP
jgi:BirA family biotin operon repressor/biotin-[acetyl-CoA-carboxylase] ligase